jgi:hypothetical protein
MAESTKTWSRQTIGVDFPCPGSSAHQRRFRSVPIWTGGFADGALPSPRGPRHRGQSPVAGDPDSSPPRAARATARNLVTIHIPPTMVPPRPEIVVRGPCLRGRARTAFAAGF